MIDDNNNEETYEEFDDDIENFDSFDNEKPSLGDMIREKPIFKFLIFGVVVLAIILVFLFLRGDAPDPISRLGEGSDISAPPGTEDVSQSIREAFEETDQQRLEEAERTGGSALPTLIEPPVDTIALPEEEQDQEDPLQRWRRLQQERIEREARQRQQQQQNLASPDDPSGLSDINALEETTLPPEQVQAIADSMAAQMQAILDRSEQDIRITTVAITPDNYMEQFEEENAIDINTEPVPETAEIVIPAGEIEYGQLMIEANSDVPGPVLARLASGPYRGARALGAFEVANEKLVLTFNTLVVDGISKPINAVAIDPGSSLPGLATEVDRRYFKRVVLPAAAAFIEGAADALSDSGQTTITIDGDQSTTTTDNSQQGTDEQVAEGVQQAAEELGQILDQEAQNTEILVRIAAGTPVGLLFLEPVIEED